MLGSIAGSVGRSALQRKLAQRAAQRKSNGGEAEAGPAQADDASVHQAAQDGLSGTAGPLPHQAAIQRSFGRHDVSHVKAHGDAAAARGAAAMGAEAFASGDRVAFQGAPSLHTAAHEAAHVVQQRGGVQLKGGVGADGDEYERHADSVADAVVAGKSAESLLDAHAAPGGGGAGAAETGPVQRKFGGPLLTRTAKSVHDELARSNPTMPALWKVERLVQDLKETYNSIEEVATKLGLQTTPSVGGQVSPPREDEPNINATPSTPLPKPHVDVTPRTTPVGQRSTPSLTPPITETRKEDEPTLTPTKTVGEPVLTPPIGNGEPPITTPELGVTPPLTTPSMSGGKTLTVSSLPLVNEPVQGKPVFKAPPEFIHVDFGGRALKLKAGQDYLNTPLSAEYKADPSKIRGADVTISPLTGRRNDDEYIIADGHHRFVWAAYHRQSFTATEKTKFGCVQWNAMKYQEDPNAPEPITDLAKVKEDFYLAFVSPEPASKSLPHGTATAFVTAKCNPPKGSGSKKIGATDEQIAQIADHITQRMSAHPVVAYDAVVEQLAGKCTEKDKAAGYRRYLVTEAKGYLGGRKPPIVLGHTETSGHYNTVHNVITLDPDILHTPEEMLDCLSFETQNARQKVALTAAKQKGGGIHTAVVEFDSDRMYVHEALMSVYEADSMDVLVSKLGIDPTLLVEESYTTASAAGGITLPPTSELGEQAKRQALWWWKTKSWNTTQQRAMWGKAPHKIGGKSSTEIYSGIGTTGVKVGM
jgi:hypothetical protein